MPAYTARIPQLHPIISHYVSGLQRLACPFSSYYCKLCQSNCALSMKLYLKSIQMMILRNGVWKYKSGTSERCKNKIHWDVNVSLIEREEMGQDKWSELIKWDEMSQPLRHLGVDLISLSALYRVVPAFFPASGDKSLQRWWGGRTTIKEEREKNQFALVIQPGQKQHVRHSQNFRQLEWTTELVFLPFQFACTTAKHLRILI